MLKANRKLDRLERLDEMILLFLAVVVTLLPPAMFGLL
jgi:hypothetical protein